MEKINNHHSPSMIHEDGGLFGILIESGCAGIVNHKLQMVSGASKTVYMSETPYSKEYQHEAYRNHSVRSIGKETSILFSNKWVHEYLTDMHKGITFIYTSTFQVGEANNISTHGWITFTDLVKMVRRVYHVSIHEKNFSRQNYINRIGEIGIHIIGSRGDVPMNVDIVEDYKLNKGFFGTYAIEKQPDISHLLLDALTKFEQHWFPICMSGGKMVRTEDIFRGKKYMIPYKGSFNPPHKAHIGYAEKITETYGEKPVFSLSLDVIEKGQVDSVEIMRRAQIINKLGYDVIIVSSGFFANFVYGMRNKFDMPIVFPVGHDTFNRIMSSTHTSVKDFDVTFGMNNAKFVVLHRFGVDLDPKHKEFDKFIDKSITVEFDELSSTQIRKLHSEKKFDELKELVPEEVYNQLIKERK